jgi:hypothetical protein
MPDVFALTAKPALARLRVAEVAVAAADDDGDARTTTIAKLARFDQRIALDRKVIDALDGRIKLRPVLPPQESTQNLVRRARRRLEQERLGAARAHHDTRLVAVTRLRNVLET